ncbi:MAG: hypothetical protein NTV34_13275 [Proteobacteria bacterium]|nr:hypothetical protein [Pseudomonadota bacterium]
MSDDIMIEKMVCLDAIEKAREWLAEVVERSGYHLVPCIDCGKVVVCATGGIAMCLPCVEKCIQCA